MKDIKVKTIKDKSVKTFDKTIAWTERIKDPVIHLNKSVNTISDKESNVSDYGAEKIRYMNNRLKDESIYASKKAVVKGKKKAIEQIKKKANVKNIKKNTKKIKKVKQRVQKIPKDVKKAKVALERAKKLAIKTTKLTIKGIKALIKLIKIGVQALIKAISGLVALLGVGGAIAVIVVVLVCLIAFLCNSVFGIFMVDENTDNSVKMTSISTELNNEMNKKIEDIKNSNTGKYSEVVINDNRSSWKNVVIIYAVKTSGGDSKKEVISIDESKKSEIRKIFFDMNKIDSNISDNKLIININAVSIETIEKQYNFNEEQIKLVKELSDSKYDRYFEGFNYDSPIFSDGYWTWPNSCKHISSPYGMRWGKLHDGLDIACPINSTIFSAADGVVVESSFTSTNGNYVIIQHNSYYTIYGHLNKRLVNVGDKVKGGDKIGLEGQTGFATGPHVHFGIWKGYPYRAGSTSINPATYFNLS